MGNESDGLGGVGNFGEDSSETGSVAKKKGKNRRPVSAPASPRTLWIKRIATTLNNGLG